MRKEEIDRLLRIEAAALAWQAAQRRADQMIPAGVDPYQKSRLPVRKALDDLSEALAPIPPKQPFYLAAWQAFLASPYLPIPRRKGP